MRVRMSVVTVAVCFCALHDAIRRRPPRIVTKASAAKRGPTSCYAPDFKSLTCCKVNCQISCHSAFSLLAHSQIVEPLLSPNGRASAYNCLGDPILRVGS
ncbi:hypothetical protein TRVL_09977 [Trypanosoma vivax]|nr:hypothetical protein TRVL_09977 [Trypanosoma vivax]